VLGNPRYGYVRNTSVPITSFFKGRVSRRIRFRACSALLCLAFTMSGIRLWAQALEPISTEFADPFGSGEGSLRIGYEYTHFAGAISGQVIPVVNLTVGAGRGLELDAGFPVFREKEEDNRPTLVGGGKLTLGARYLLAGGERHPYAVSLVAFVEAPTGRRSVVGDGSELRGGVLVDRNLSDRILLHSNLTWGTTIGGSTQKRSILEYHSAVVWPMTLHIAPAFEVVGDSDTGTGTSDLALQPEIILRNGPHVELKVGLPYGLTSASSGVGVRAQLAILWGQ
jgi:hypothetical protein